MLLHVDRTKGNRRNSPREAGESEFRSCATERCKVRTKLVTLSTVQTILLVASLFLGVQSADVGTFVLPLLSQLCCTARNVPQICSV